MAEAFKLRPPSGPSFPRVVGQRIRRVVTWKNVFCACGLWVSYGTLQAHLASPRHVDYRDQQKRALAAGGA